MGQLTDDILDGLMCSQCGTCFEKAHGYPVLCRSCAKDCKGPNCPPRAKHKEL